MEDPVELELSPVSDNLELEGIVFEAASAGNRHVDREPQDSGAGVGPLEPMEYGPAPEEAGASPLRTLNPRTGVESPLGRISQLIVRESGGSGVRVASSASAQHRSASSASAASNATTSRTGSNATHRTTSSFSLQAPPSRGMRGLRSLPSIEHDEDGEGSGLSLGRSLSSPVSPAAMRPSVEALPHTLSRFRSPLALGQNHKPLVHNKASSNLLFPSSGERSAHPLKRSMSQNSTSSPAASASRLSASRRVSSGDSPKRRDSSTSWSGARRTKQRKRNMQELTPFMLFALQGPGSMSRIPSGDHSDWSHGSVRRRWYSSAHGGEGAGEFGDSGRDSSRGGTARISHSTPGSPESCASSHAGAPQPPLLSAATLSPPPGNGSGSARGRLSWDRFTGGHAGILGSRALMQSGEGSGSSVRRSSRDNHPPGSPRVKGSFSFGPDDEEWSEGTRGSIAGLSRFGLKRSCNEGLDKVQVLRDFLQMRAAAERGALSFEMEEAEDELRLAGLYAGSAPGGGGGVVGGGGGGGSGGGSGGGVMLLPRAGSSESIISRTESAGSARGNAFTLDRVGTAGSNVSVSGRRRAVVRKPMLESLYTRACIRPHSLQDKALRRLRGEAVGLRPLLEPSSPFLLMLLVVGGLCIFWSVAAALALYHAPTHLHASRLRFSVYPPRPSALGAAPLARVELLRTAGCGHEHRHAYNVTAARHLDVAGPVAEVELQAHVEFDGWSIKAHDPSEPNTCWRVDTWDEEEGKWKAAGSGRWRTMVDGRMLKLQHRHCHVAMERVQLRPWWVWDVSAVGGGAIGGVAMVVAAVLAWFGRRETANRALQATCLVCGAIEVGCAIAYSSQWQEWREEAWMSWIRALVLGAALLLQLKVARFQSLWLLILSATLAAAVLVERTVEFDAEASVLAAAELTILLLAVLAVALRGLQKSQELAESLKAMEEEIGRYERVWSETLRECPGATEALEGIEGACRRYESTAHAQAAHMRRMQAPGWSGMVGRGKWVRVSSLEQLYVQAAVVAPMLFQRVAKWGTAVGGRCHVSDKVQEADVERDEAGMVSWEEVWDRRKESGWGYGAERVKGVARAMAKLVQVYSFDTARVCDVCRQTIWITPDGDEDCGGLGKVVQCLDAIAQDASVEVVAVKNAMLQGDGPALHTAGFRFVKVLLRIVCPQARRLGVDGHVCEVILALQVMAPSREEEVRKRYLRFRKARSDRDRLVACLAWRRRLVQACSGGRQWWERASEQQWGLRGGEASASPNATMHGIQDSDALLEPWKLEEEEEVDEEEVEGQRRLWAGIADEVVTECRWAMWKVVVGRQLGGEPGKVERRAENMYEAVAKASTSSVLSMPRPIAAMLCKPVFVLLVTLAAGWMLYMVSAMMARHRTHSSEQLRFTTLRRRDGHEPVTHPGVGQLMALLDDCEAKAPIQSFLVNGSQITIAYEQEIRWNVLRLQTQGHVGPEADAAAFRVEQRRRSEGVLGEWEPICSAAFEGGVVDGSCYEGWRTMHDVLALPLARGQWLDLRVAEGWWQLAAEEASIIVVAIALLGGVLLALLHKQILAKRVMAGSMWVSTLLLLIRMSLNFSDKHTWEGVWSLCTAAAVAVVAGCIQWRERRLIDAILLSGIINWVKALALAARAGGRSASELIDVTASLQIGMAVVMKLYGMVGHWKAARLAAQDTKVYQQIWEEVMEKEGAKETLELIDSWRSDLLQEAVEQRGVPWSERHDNDEALGVGWWQDASLSHTRELHRLCPPLHSIDQILAQSEVSSVLLKAKLQEWAMASNGMFLLEKEVRGRGRFVRWEEAVQEEGLQAGIKWGGVKGRERAMEKMHRCYKGRCARLCDVSRQSIVFDSLEDMLACLEAMAIDQEILLVRVKNTLHPQAEKLSWGYRQVCINLLHCSELTERLGLSLHVSEVQLILEPFAALKSDEGHRRYVEARNARGE